MLLTYSYDALNRLTYKSALSDLDNRSYASRPTSATSYVYLNGQPMSELNNANGWTDYIYANGQKIARLTSSDPHIHIQGTSSGPTSWVSWPLPSSPNGYTLRTGDVLTFRQWQSSTARGGVNLLTQQPSGSGAYTAWVDQDQDGQYTNDDGVTGQWHKRVIRLDRLAGNVVTGLLLLGDQGSSGNWTVDFADMSLVSADGSVRTLYNGGNASMSPNYNYGMTNVQQSVATAAEPGTNGATYYYLSDHLGTAQMEIAAGGWPVWQGQFTLFGQEVGMPYSIGPQSSDGSSMHFKFTGKERDSESGLDYFGARYYSSVIGRFSSPDWASKPEAVPYSSLDNPQTLNLYAYVGNNPLSRVDADGHVWPWLQKVWNFISSPGILNDPKLSPVQRQAAVSDAVAAHDEAAHELVTETIQLIGVVAESESPMGALPTITPGEVGIPATTPAVPSSPSFVSMPSGDVVPIPQGATGPTPVVNGSGNITGSQYQGGAGGNGMDAKTTGVRIMDPTPPRGASPGYPNGNASYNNASGQTVNPQTGRTVPNADPSAHIPFKPQQ